MQLHACVRAMLDVVCKDYFYFSQGASLLHQFLNLFILIHYSCLKADTILHSLMRDTTIYLAICCYYKLAVQILCWLVCTAYVSLAFI